MHTASRTQCAEGLPTPSLRHSPKPHGPHSAAIRQRPIALLVPYAIIVLVPSRGLRVSQGLVHLFPRLPSGHAIGGIVTAIAGCGRTAIATPVAFLVLCRSSTEQQDPTR